MIAQGIRSPGIVRDYIALTKPRIISLLLVTALGGMVLAAKGLPDPMIAAFVIVCGYLAAGGAHALNHYIESDIDSLMHRTRKRPRRQRQGIAASGPRLRGCAHDCVVRAAERLRERPERGRLR